MEKRKRKTRPVGMRFEEDLYIAVFNASVADDLSFAQWVRKCLRETLGMTHTEERRPHG